MIQLRWSDENNWKDFPKAKSVEEAQMMWYVSEARFLACYGRRPTMATPEFRVKPDLVPYFTAVIEGRIGV